MTTCGLSNVGAASEGYGQHGTYTARAGDRPAGRAHDLRGDRHGHGRRRAVHAVAPHRDHRRPGARPHRRPRRQRLRVDGGGAAALPRQPRRAAVGRGRLPRDGCAGGRAARRGMPQPSCATWDEPPAVGRRSAGARLRARRRLVGAPHEPEARRRAHAPLVAAAAVAVGRPGERDLRARHRAGELLGARPRSTTSRRAGCRSSTRARRARRGSRSPHGRSRRRRGRQCVSACCAVPARAGSAPAAPGAA